MAADPSGSNNTDASSAEPVPLPQEMARVVPRGGRPGGEERAGQPSLQRSSRRVLCYPFPAKRVKAIWRNLEAQNQLFSAAVRRTRVGENLRFSAAGIGFRPPDEPLLAAQPGRRARVIGTSRGDGAETPPIDRRSARRNGGATVNLGAVGRVVRGCAPQLGQPRDWNRTTGKPPTGRSMT